MSDIRIGVIGGSGLATALARESGGTAHTPATPFGPASGPVTEIRWGDVPVFVLARHGPGHVFSPSAVPYRANIFALKALGVTHLIASGAVGSLREEYRPGDLVIPDQIIDKTQRAATFFDSAAVHVEFAEPFDSALRRLLVEAGEDLTVDGAGQPTRVHDGGCYVAMEGPAFGTRAESLMHRLWGGDLIGMTAMPEAKLAREAEIAYATIALVTDYDSWRNKPPVMPAAPTIAKAEAQPAPAPARPPIPPPDPVSLLAEIRQNLDAASSAAVALLKRAVGRAARAPDELKKSSASTALAHAIWTEKSRIEKEEVARLAPLWIKYFQA